MAKDNSTTTAPAAIQAMVAPPANVQDFAAERARRDEERAAKRDKLMDCLDPTVAKYWEDRKDLFEWKVEVQLFRKAVGKQHAHMEKITENVVAHNEDDAWAMFCDKQGEWPSRRDSKAKFTRLKRRTLRHNEMTDGDDN